MSSAPDAEHAWLLGAQRPRIATFPTGVSSAGTEAVELARMAGVELDPWQAYGLEVGLAETEEQRWAAFEVAVNGPRQNGKNEIALARELAGLFLFNEELIIHSAHEFKTSTEHQRRVEEVIQNTPDLHKRVKPRGYRHSHGEEGIELRSGQRIRFMTRTKGGGRGHTGDLVVFDEAMILAAAMLGALMPTLSARSVFGNPQIWYFLTAVDQLIHEHGLVAAKLRERGLAGGDSSLAYLEWSARVLLPDGREAGPDEVPAAAATDPAVWAQANPAMGLRISEEHIANEQRSMAARTFAVERLGVGDWPSLTGEAAVIDLDLWATLADSKSKAEDPVCFAFDVTPDRSYSTIAAAGHRADGFEHVEVIRHDRGTGWVVARLVELVAKHKPVGVVCDGAGPAASLLPELAPLLAELEIEPRLVTAKEHAQACGLIYDAVEQKRVRHLAQPEMGSALRAAAKRPLGDAWAWSRKSSSADISPLVACTLALWGLTSLPPEEESVGFAVITI